MFEKLENNEMVTFLFINELEERTDVTIEDCGMSGKDVDLRWFVVRDLITGKEKSLYVKI